MCFLKPWQHGDSRQYARHLQFDHTLHVDPGLQQNLLTVFIELRRARSRRRAFIKLYRGCDKFEVRCPLSSLRL